MNTSAKTVLGQLNSLSGNNVRVYGNRCVRVRNRNATCEACADVCTTGAISVGEHGFEIKENLCIGCGTCATACPTCALESLNPTDSDLFERAYTAMNNNGGQAVFACASNLDKQFGKIDESKVCRVTCIGRVDESLIATLKKAGATDICFVEHGCDTCIHASGRDTACAVANSAASILEIWGNPLPITFIDSFPRQIKLNMPFEADVALPDSDLSYTENNARIESAPAENPEQPHLMKTGKNGVLPQYVPSRRGQLLSTLKDLGPIPSEPVSSRLWATVSIDTNVCGSCRLCAVFCPTGALAKFDDRTSATFGIKHTPGKCVACGTCRDICPKHAITLLDGVEAADLYDNSCVTFTMRPREVEPGKPDTIIRKMRNLLTDSKYVSQA